MDMQIQKDYLFKRLGEQTIQIEIMTEQLKSLKDKINDLEEKIKELSKDGEV